MNRTAVLGVAAAVVATIVVLAGALVLLRPTPGGSQGQGTPVEASTSSAAAVPARPDCPGREVGGVELDCLGGGYVDPAIDVTVVNVWAWWCEPCREELPVIEQFAAENPQFSVVGVHADAAAANGAAMLNELGVGLPSYQDSDNTFAGTLGLPGVIPLTVVFRGDEQLAVFPKVFGSAAELDAAVTGVL
ncbi:MULTISPECIES: TlpA family protein disulfide reductase [Corynebacterium]|uniref:TlpA family protein disulfide reductase n=1 Tax=Corynebacterium TaxID=1716 RepID=UPI001643DB08|nr:MULTISPECIES: TlpA disulfide reductase family protein [Corynebacterium]MCT1463398.1 TlpA family protein disulfide reductase [Corynebacterium sanguinis]MCT1499611.1 TlpA family protein disulfide reductase [Corynebacterium sanguinis]MCT1555514.1 TlpA family protein disulfide reductase [Corynebacterium sanguinis]MCT1584851.1 TlpA family protein disulfide reductase [Corynebacterium sanguinis]MCT1614137.1 TlpA family protein disulfide reductase [Corynebacterium sanguinis]